jgi:hypothetical protein
LADNLDGASYANFGRRLAAYLLDCGVLTLVLLLVGITLHVFRVVGLLVPPAEVTPEEAWKALGPNAKLFVAFAFVLRTLGATR